MDISHIADRWTAARFESGATFPCTGLAAPPTSPGMSRSIFPLEDEPVLLPRGFLWAAAEAGIRYVGRPDLAVIDGGPACRAAAVFTQNAFAAAPVVVSRQILHRSGGHIRGVVVNAGCANAATGPQGLTDAQLMAETTATTLGSTGSLDVLVCSTGTIGVRLPMEKVLPAIARACADLANDRESFLNVARAILTTDTRPKYAARELIVDGNPVRLLGCAKGSGMIYPRMATLLAFIATDARLAPPDLQLCFGQAIERTLNCLTVDGDTSTNDSAIILANGASGVEFSRATPEKFEIFTSSLRDLLESLTIQLARDGEGATKLVEIEVVDARSFEEARRVALAIANSNLVKTAIHGRDANWGRIACAIGNAGVTIEPERVRIGLGELVLFERGGPVAFSEERAQVLLSEENVRIRVELGLGHAAAKAWTCDLSAKYIEINGAYRT